MVLHHFIGVKDIASDLVAPPCDDMLPLEPCLLLRLLRQLKLEEARAEDLQRRLPILKLGALILTGSNEPRGEMGYPNRGAGLLHMLTSGSTGPG